MEQVFINPKRNDSFSSLRGFDLQDLLIETQNYFLSYRDTLNLPSNVTFGFEIEYEGVSQEKVKKFIKSNYLPNWKLVPDGSLNSGGEINSSIIKDKITDWQQLKLMCDYLTSQKADTSQNAGGHIHLGAQVLGKDIDAWKQFFKLYAAYESVLFRFAYGDKLSDRTRLFHFAPPSAPFIISLLKLFNDKLTVYELGKLVPEWEKNSALNLGHVFFDAPDCQTNGNTIEFRFPNDTTNAVIWQNEGNAFAKMLVSAQSKAMNEDFLDFKLKHEFVSYYDGGEYLYSEINLKNVLEFVDLAFDNNLDKIYFLRQYLKGFQDSYGTKSAQQAASFTR